MKLKATEICIVYLLCRVIDTGDTRCLLWAEKLPRGNYNTKSFTPVWPTYKNKIMEDELVFISGYHEGTRLLEIIITVMAFNSNEMFFFLVFLTCVF